MRQRGCSSSHYLSLPSLLLAASFFGALLFSSSCEAIFSAGGPYKVRIGTLVATNDITTESLVKWAAFNINSNGSILLNTSLEVYSVQYDPSNISQIEGAATNLRNLVDVALVNIPDSELGAVAQIFSAHQVPVISINSVASEYVRKNSFPYLLRVALSKYYEAEAIILTLKSLGITEVAYFYSSDLTMEFFQQFAYYYQVSVIAVKLFEEFPPLVKKSYLSSIQCIITDIPYDNSLRLVLYSYINENDLYGPDLAYILTRDSWYLYSIPSANIFTQGSFGMQALEQGYPQYVSQVISEWQAANRTMFPGQTQPSTNSWRAFDTVHLLAHAVDALIHSERTLYGEDLLLALYGTAINGVTGSIKFDSNGDRLGKFNAHNIIYTLANQTTYLEINVATKNTTKLSTPVFYGGNTLNPVIVKSCNITCSDHGTCTTLGCVCDPGFTGKVCENLMVVPTPPPEDQRDTPKTFLSTDIVATSVPIGFICILIVISVVLFYRYKHLRLVKHITTQQGSLITKNDVTFHKKIGTGASGDVYRATFRGTDVAVKCITTTQSDSSIIEAFQIETAIMCGLRHPNIIIFMGSCFDLEKKEMLLIMEYMELGSLYDVIHDPKIPLPYELCLHIAIQAATGITFLHGSSPPIIHRDIKSHNILIDRKWNVRIGDFGITRVKEIANQDTKESKSLGTVFWCAPEVLENAHTYSEASDCYSFAIVLWELFHRANPYGYQDPMAVALSVMHMKTRPPIAPYVPEDIKKLLERCWAQKPSDRPSMPKVLQTLRSLAGDERSMVGEHGNSVPAHFFIVVTTIQSINTLWTSAPRVIQNALELLNNAILDFIKPFHGTIEGFDVGKVGYCLSFPSLLDATNFCILAQVSALNLSWDLELLHFSQSAEVLSEDGKLMWRGLRLRFAIHTGSNMSEVTEKAWKVLTKHPHGSMVASRTAGQQILHQRSQLLERLEMEKMGDIYQMLPLPLFDRAEVTTKPESLPYQVIDDEAHAHDIASWREQSLPDIGILKYLIQWSELAILSLIAKGRTGDFFLATWKQHKVAVKMMANQKFGSSDLIDIRSDAAIMSQMDHPNLLPLYGICTEPDHISLIVEHMERGSLSQVLSSSPDPLPPSRIFAIARDIALGMEYLSSHSDPSLHIHHNFKSDNVVISGDWHAKISDYGFFRLHSLARTVTSVIDASWTAPEVLQGYPISPISAVYSYGMILWQLVTRQAPFHGIHPVKVVTNVLYGARPPITDYFPLHYRMLMEECWDSNPKQRPTWSRIILELDHMLASTT